MIKAKFTDSLSNHSTIIPERLDPFINKYAEYTHDRWAFEKVEQDCLITSYYSSAISGSTLVFSFNS